MHEMTYIVSLVNQAAKTASVHKALAVASVWVQVGEMTGLEPFYLKKYYGEAVKGTILEGSRLEIIPVPVEAECRDCGKMYHPGRENDYACPACGSVGARLIRGREYLLDHLEIVSEEDLV